MIFEIFQWKFHFIVALKVFIIYFSMFYLHTQKKIHFYLSFLSIDILYIFCLFNFSCDDLFAQNFLFFASSQKTKDEKSSIFSLAFFIISDIRYKRKMRNIDLSKNKKQWIALLRVSIFEFSSTSSSVVDDLKNYKS